MPVSFELFTLNVVDISGLEIRIVSKGLISIFHVEPLFLHLLHHFELVIGVENPVMFQIIADFIEVRRRIPRLSLPFLLEEAFSVSPPLCIMSNSFRNNVANIIRNSVGQLATPVLLRGGIIPGQIIRIRVFLGMI